MSKTGSVWVNLSDTYSTVSGAAKKLGAKTLVGIPDRFKIKMIDNGFTCRNEIIWHKPNSLPSGNSSGFTVDYEKLLWFTLQPCGYFFEQQFEPYQNEKDVEYRSKLRKDKKYNLKQPYKSNTPYSKIPRADVENCSSPRGRAHRSKELYNLKGRNKRAVWSIPTKPSMLSHTASYPEALVDIPLKATCPENGVIYDPFMGSGTTAVVALQNGRRFIGSEINKEYCSIANKRIQSTVIQEKLPI